MPNMKTGIINSHIEKIINAKTITKERTCNCITVEAKSLLSQSCLNNNICKTILASTNTSQKEKIYFGTAETTFKLRYSNHQRSFKFLKSKTDTELSNKVWQMKMSRQTQIIT